MRIPLYILFALSVFSCHQESHVINYNLYNTWRWQELYPNPNIPAETSSSLDTTYYYSFRTNGTLIISDIHRNEKLQRQFIVQDGVITIDNLPYSYYIKNDTLRITNIYGIIGWTNLFTIDKFLPEINLR